MASLMENLVQVLSDECTMYEQLLGLSSRKTAIIVSGNLKALAEITDEEQCVIGKIASLDKKREVAMENIASVLNTDVDSLKLTDLIGILEKRPEDQKSLAVQRDRLVNVAGNVRRVNSQNQELLKSSLEMVKFEMNIIQAARRAPQTANYSRTAGTTGDVIGYTSGGFDAKQ